MAVEALEYDATTGEWSGELPQNCEVWAQWFVDGSWQPKTEYGVRRRDEGIAVFRRAVQTGPLKYEKYRLVRANRRMRKRRGEHESVPEPDEQNQREVSEMDNPFRAGTDRAKVFDILRDGKPRTQKEVDAEHGSPVHRSAMWGIHMGGQKHGYRLVRGKKHKMWIVFGDQDEARENLPKSEPPITPAKPKKAKDGKKADAAPAEKAPKKGKKGKKAKASDTPDKSDKGKGGKKDKGKKKAEPADPKPKKAKKSKKDKSGKTDRVRL